MNTLEYHMKRKHNHGLETNTYFCIVCLINSAFNRSLDNHMKAIHQDHMHLFDGDIDESLLVYSCKSCEYKFVNEQILRNHQNTGTRRHQKQELFANFVIVNLISHHRLRSTRRSYTKKISGHLRVVTRMIAYYECPHCSLMFIIENFLKYHTTLKHKEESKQNDSDCKLCYLDFKFNSQLNAHKKGFTRQEEKGKHSLLVESSASPHKCKYCKTNCNAILSRKSCDGSK